MKHKAVLGIDTSNYTTSVALVDTDGAIILDKRIPLKVKQGERGLRQSHALFQHMENLPELLESALSITSDWQVAAVAVSSRPRSIEGSYMPVFKAGVQFGRVLAKACGAELLEFSHQEGHLAAASFETGLHADQPFLAYHLSGGTCELLLAEGEMLTIIGGTKDISFGQVLDRIGVAMGLPFPCGKEMDKAALLTKSDAGIAAQHELANWQLKPVPIDQLQINLSGLETQLQRRIEPLSADLRKKLLPQISALLLTAVSDCLIQLTERAVKQTGISNVLFTGGVSASSFIRMRLTAAQKDIGATLFFGKTELSSDNAVGAALLGRRSLWH